MAVGSKDLAPAELDTFEDERLLDELRRAKEELFNLRFQHATGALENTSNLTGVRRELARLLTIQGEQADKMEGGAS